jgi:hypothetical protein
MIKTVLRPDDFAAGPLTHDQGRTCGYVGRGYDARTPQRALVTLAALLGITLNSFGSVVGRTPASPNTVKLLGPAMMSRMYRPELPFSRRCAASVFG